MDDDENGIVEDGEGLLAQLMSHRQFDYFACFQAMVELSVREADLLLEVVSGFTDAKGVEPYLARAHGIEEECDQYVRAATRAANTDFLPPIEAEDVVELAMALDQITDELERCVKHMFMYNVRRIEPASVEMVGLIRDECAMLSEAMGYFRDFRKPKKLQKRAARIEEAEARIDELYLYAVHDLFDDEQNTLRVIKWQALYGTIERCADSIQHAIDLMVRIVVKNV